MQRPSGCCRNAFWVAKTLGSKRAQPRGTSQRCARRNGHKPLRGRLGMLIDPSFKLVTPPLFTFEPEFGPSTADNGPHVPMESSVRCVLTIEASALPDGPCLSVSSSAGSVPAKQCVEQNVLLGASVIHLCRQGVGCTGAATACTPTMGGEREILCQWLISFDAACCMALRAVNVCKWSSRTGGQEAERQTNHWGWMQQLNNLVASLGESVFRRW